MARINRTDLYVYDGVVSDNDYIIGSDGDTVGAKTKSYKMKDVRDFLLAGLSPIVGGTMQYTEYTYNGGLTSPAAVLNALNPVFVVLPYHLVVVSVNGDKYILKSQDVTVGIGQTPLSDSNFILLRGDVSLGDGLDILKGYNVSNKKHEFYSLKSTSLNLSKETISSIETGNILVEMKTDINLHIGVDSERVYKGYNAVNSKHEFKGIKDSTSLDVSSDTTDISIEIKENLVSISTAPSAIDVYDSFNNTTKKHGIKGIKSGSLVLTESGGDISIDLPSDESAKYFYVSENAVDANGNGSLAKPFKYLKQAIDAFKGTGTILSPQYAGTGTIQLLSNVTVNSLAIDATYGMTYISVNKLKINGGGFTLVYKGVQDYFISTEYLISLDPKSVSLKLDNEIQMEFEDLIITSETTHKIVKHLNYTSSTTTGSQNTSGMSFTNCSIIDSAYLSELGSYGTSTVSYFGILVKTQNGLSADNYNVYAENVNWNGEGALNMINCKIQGSSSTPVYVKNTSISFNNVGIDFNPFYVNYQTVASDIYSVRTGLHFIKSENTGTVGNQYKASNFVGVTDFKESSQEAVSGGEKMGGCESFYNGIGAGSFEVTNGSFFSEKFNNLTITNTASHGVSLKNLNCDSIDIKDATYGAFKYTGTTPVSRIYYPVNGSSIKNIKQNASLMYVYPSGPYANINGTYFSNISGLVYADNTAALAGGLVPGCYYYKTTTNAVTVVV